MRVSMSFALNSKPPCVLKHFAKTSKPHSIGLLRLQKTRKTDPEARDILVHHQLSELKLMLVFQKLKYLMYFLARSHQPFVDSCLSKTFPTRCACRCVQHSSVLKHFAKTSKPNSIGFPLLDSKKAHKADPESTR